MVMRLGALVGSGNTADVFDAGNGMVVKLFLSEYPESNVMAEFENSRLLNGLDMPIARSHGTIAHENRFGIIYDKIEGESLLEILFKTNDVKKCTAILAETHKKILCKDVSDLVDLKSRLRNKIDCAEDLNKQNRSKLLGILKGLPDGSSLCHGDFHYGNLLMAEEKPYVIDFMDVCKGHKNFDIARTLYLIGMTPVPESMPHSKEIVEMKNKAADLYLKEMAVSKRDLSKWLAVIVAARLTELSREQSIEKEIILAYLSAQAL